MKGAHVSKNKVPEGVIPRAANFVLGGLAGMTSVAFVHPMDLVKNRMQLSGEGGRGVVYQTSLHAASRVVSHEGALAVYRGLSAALLRQAVYGSTRLGVYQCLVEQYNESHKAIPNIGTKLAIGMLAGGVGAAVSTPTDVALVRMMADGRQPVWRQRGYTSVFNALTRIIREEGALVLWRGCTPTILRAVIVNGVEQGSYWQTKEQLLATDYFEDTLKCHVTASMISGLFSTAVSLPVDICKTRMQNMQGGTYNSLLDTFSSLVRKEGIRSLWKGFTPYYSRMGPHNVLIFVFLEKYRLLYYNYYKGHFVL